MQCWDWSRELIVANLKLQQPNRLCDSGQCPRDVVLGQLQNGQPPELVQCLFGKGSAHMTSGQKNTRHIGPETGYAIEALHRVAGVGTQRAVTLLQACEVPIRAAPREPRGGTIGVREKRVQSEELCGG